jgi:hypothetical protein
LYFKRFVSLVVATLVLDITTIDDVNAAGIGVWCEVRGLERSKVNVKGRKLPRGKYFAKILSGGVWVKSGVKVAVNRQVEFEFDSHSDEGPGVTIIPPTFIKDLKILGVIRDAKSKRLIGKMSDACDFRDEDDSDDDS